MNLREEYARMQRLRGMARQCPVEPGQAAAMIQPFIDKYKNLQLERKGAGGRAGPHPEHARLVAALRTMGAGQHRAGLKGLRFHNTFQRTLAALGAEFGYRGFIECLARYDLPEEAVCPGRMDVVWADSRVPRVLFEIDRTVKPVSLQKLQQADAPHKYWIYFGPDVWTFKVSVKRWDPSGEIVPVVIPPTFAPRFSGGER